jgi:HK97 gp10 family phage protein
MTTAAKFVVQITPIDESGIYKMMQDAADSAMRTWLNKVAADAKNRAPIRKSFHQGRRRERWVTVFEHAGSVKDVSKAYSEYFGGGGDVLYRSRSQRYHQLREAVTAKREGRPARKIPARPRFRVVTAGSASKVQIRAFRPTETKAIDTRRSGWSLAGKNAVGPLLELGGGVTRGVTRGPEREAYEERRSGSYLQFDAWEQLTARGKADLTHGVDVFAAGEKNNTKPGTKPGSMSALVAGVSAMPQLGGRLKRSIAPDDTKVVGNTVTGSVTANIRYARYVEFGTHKHGAAQPFMRPALWQNKKLLAASFASDVRGQFGFAYSGTRGKRGKGK